MNYCIRTLTVSCVVMSGALVVVVVIVERMKAAVVVDAFLQRLSHIALDVNLLAKKIINV